MNRLKGSIERRGPPEIAPLPPPNIYVLFLSIHPPDHHKPATSLHITNIIRRCCLYERTKCIQNANGRISSSNSSLTHSFVQPYGIYCDSAIIVLWFFVATPVWRLFFNSWSPWSIESIHKDRSLLTIVISFWGDSSNRSRGRRRLSIDSPIKFVNCLSVPRMAGQEKTAERRAIITIYFYCGRKRK